MESEKKIFEMLEAKTPMTKYWLPLTWATNIINRARKESLITNDHMVQTILLEMSDLRSRLGSLIGYDNVNIPIVYTQVNILQCIFLNNLFITGKKFSNCKLHLFFRAHHARVTPTTSSFQEVIRKQIEVLENRPHLRPLRWGWNRMQFHFSQVCDGYKRLDWLNRHNIVYKHKRF